MPTRYIGDGYWEIASRQMSIVTRSEQQRFKDAKINKKLCQYLENETGCIDINFDTITDYIILIVFLLKNYGLTKTELSRLVIDFEKCVEDFRTKIPINIFIPKIFSIKTPFTPSDSSIGNISSDVDKYTANSVP